MNHFDFNLNLQSELIFKIINIVLVQALIKNQSSLVHYIDYTKTLMT